MLKYFFDIHRIYHLLQKTNLHTKEVGVLFYIKN